jgi:hypothetical protein
MLKESQVWKGLLIWEGPIILVNEKAYLEAYWISAKGINSDCVNGFLIIKTILFKHNKIKETLEHNCTKTEANEMLKVKLLIDNIIIEKIKTK